MDNYTQDLLVADDCISLAGYISALIYTENHLLKFGDQLLLTLFTLSCDPTFYRGNLSVETIYESNTAWQDAITLLMDKLTLEDCKHLTLKLAKIFGKFFQSESLNENHMQIMIDVAVNFLRAVYRSKPLSLSEYFVVFFDQLFFKEWEADIHGLCKGAEFVKGSLCCPFERLAPPKSKYF